MLLGYNYSQSYSLREAISCVYIYLVTCMVTQLVCKINDRVHSYSNGMVQKHPARRMCIHVHLLSCSCTLGMLLSNHYSYICHTHDCTLGTCMLLSNHYMYISHTHVPLVCCSATGHNRYNVHTHMYISCCAVPWICCLAITTYTHVHLLSYTSTWYLGYTA